MSKTVVYETKNYEVVDINGLEDYVIRDKNSDWESDIYDDFEKVLEDLPERN